MDNRKKIAIVSMAIVLTVLFFNLNVILAQVYKKDQGSARGDDLVLIEEKMDKIMEMITEKSNPDKVNKEISIKLDKILSNQEKILKELEVVKVRASMKG
ncbi:hypothetical protein EPO66_00655 [bacterium]|nr:MAG: hypothetical protein EPO66_00655 [bacterium]